MRPMRTALEIVFWASAVLIAWTQVGYAFAMGALARLLAPAPKAAVGDRARTNPPNQSVSLIVAAHDEQAVIAAKVANALALDYPRELLQVIVACDGCTDATAKHASDAGADLVLELPRGGKIVAQDAAVERASGEIVAFSDANCAMGAGRAARARGRVCGSASRLCVRTGALCAGRTLGARRRMGRPRGAQPPTRRVCTGATRWRCARRESRLSSITAGNGAIYATRRESYIVVDPIMGHDLSFPFNMVKRGWRAVYVPSARATEKMVPSIEGELARKRRMMSHTWPIVLRGGMLSPRGYTLRLRR